MHAAHETWRPHPEHVSTGPAETTTRTVSSCLQLDTVLVVIPSGPGCKLLRGEAAKARMGPAGVVVDPRFFDDLPGRRQAAEQVLIEALVAEAAIQALDEAVLHWLARRDVVPLDGLVLLPVQDCPRGEFGAVVADDHQWPATPGNESIELSGDTDAGQRGVNDQRQASLGEVVDHDQHRKRRPSSSMSETKSRLQRWFGPCGRVIGARVPSARLRPPRRLTVSRSSR